MDRQLAIEGGQPAVTAPIDDRWEPITERERTLVNGALEAGSAVYDQIEKFEAEFREFVGTRFALAVCNGTAALHSAMFAAGAALGREVIVPSVTWHASISPALHCGASPVFADADPETFCIDPADVRRKLTDRTCAIVATHVYGNPADLDALLDIVDGTDITLIEDASHAHGASWRGQQVGSVGHIGCFSMQASKPISGVEAGVAVTNDPQPLRPHGRARPLRTRQSTAADRRAARPRPHWPGREVPRQPAGHRPRPRGPGAAAGSQRPPPALVRPPGRPAGRRPRRLSAASVRRRPSAADSCCMPPASTPRRSARQSR